MKWIKNFGALLALVSLLFVSMVMIDHEFNEDELIVTGVYTVDGVDLSDDFIVEIVSEAENLEKDKRGVLRPAHFVKLYLLGLEKTNGYTGEDVIAGDTKSRNLFLLKDGGGFIYVFQKKFEQGTSIQWKDLSHLSKKKTDYWVRI